MKNQKITLKKEKIYELAYVNIIVGKEAQLQNEYFPKAMPLIQKYGGKMIGSFSVVRNESKGLPSNMVAFFEWPSADNRLSLLEDEEFKKIVPIRNEALSDANLSYFEVVEDITLDFKADKVYEFVNASLVKDQMALSHLKEYGEISEPIKQNYGGSYPKPIIKFIAIDAKGQATYIADIQFLIEWDSLEDLDKLFSNKQFATKALPVIQKAVSNMDNVFVKLIPNNN